MSARSALRSWLIPQVSARWHYFIAACWSGGARRGASRALTHEAGQRLSQGCWIDGMTDHGVGARPSRQPAVIRPADDEQHGRAVINLVLGLPADAHPA